MRGPASPGSLLLLHHALRPPVEALNKRRWRRYSYCEAFHLEIRKPVVNPYRQCAGLRNAAFVASCSPCPIYVRARAALPLLPLVAHYGSIPPALRRASERASRRSSSLFSTSKAAEADLLERASVFLCIAELSIALVPMVRLPLVDMAGQKLLDLLLLGFVAGSAQCIPDTRRQQWHSAPSSPSAGTGRQTTIFAAHSLPLRTEAGLHCPVAPFLFAANLSPLLCVAESSQVQILSAWSSRLVRRTNSHQARSNERKSEQGKSATGSAHGSVKECARRSIRTRTANECSITTPPLPFSKQQNKNLFGTRQDKTIQALLLT